MRSVVCCRSGSVKTCDVHCLEYLDFGAEACDPGCFLEIRAITYRCLDIRCKRLILLCLRCTLAHACFAVGLINHSTSDENLGNKECERVQLMTRMVRAVGVSVALKWCCALIV